MIANMTQKLRNEMEAQIKKNGAMHWEIQEKFNEDLEEIKNRQSIMTSTIIEMKNITEGTNNRITDKWAER